MNAPAPDHRSAMTPVAWLSAALAGVVGPAGVLLWLAGSPAAARLDLASGPLLAIGLMGMGMIAAAVAGRLWVGVVLALSTGAGLILFAQRLGLPALPQPLSTAFALIVASISFAARGALFARSAAGRGWLIALLVVGGEAAMLVTAWIMPDALPKWLLVLLPAQWASMAIQNTLTGTGEAWAAVSALIALAGTAAATLLVARLWPRRWPYLIMFTAWLGLSALVWHWPGPAMPSAGSQGMAVTG